MLWNRDVVTKWHHMLKKRGVYVGTSTKVSKSQHIINVLYRENYFPPIGYIPQELRTKREEPVDIIHHQKTTNHESHVHPDRKTLITIPKQEPVYRPRYQPPPKPHTIPANPSDGPLATIVAMNPRKAIKIRKGNMKTGTRRKTTNQKANPVLIIRGV